MKSKWDTTDIIPLVMIGCLILGTGFVPPSPNDPPHGHSLIGTSRFQSGELKGREYEIYLDPKTDQVYRRYWNGEGYTITR